MCARFTLTNRLNRVVQEMVELMLDHAPDWDQGPLFNISPTQQVAAVRATADAGKRELVPLKWGLIPSWAKDPKIATQCINARAETVATKPAFRSAFKKRRCLILADGYYEWTGAKGKKQPWHFHLKDHRPFAFAGLWEHCKPPEGEPVETCTIVTTEPNELQAKYHDRMPLILHPDDYARWVDPANQDVDDVSELLVRYPADEMTVLAASTTVNSPKYDGPVCLKP
jgi:putative SOS response-associated peptidase YedK